MAPYTPYASLSILPGDGENLGFQLLLALTYNVDHFRDVTDPLRKASGLASQSSPGSTAVRDLKVFPPLI